MKESIERKKKNQNLSSFNKSSSKQKSNDEITSKDKLITNFFKKSLNINVNNENNSEMNEINANYDLITGNSIEIINDVIPNEFRNESQKESLNSCFSNEKSKNPDKCINNSAGLLENIGEINISKLSIKPPINKSKQIKNSILFQEMSESKDSKLLNKKRRNSEHTKCKF